MVRLTLSLAESSLVLVDAWMRQEPYRGGSR
jgi:hypothetical protein